MSLPHTIHESPEPRLCFPSLRPDQWTLALDVWPQPILSFHSVSRALRWVGVTLLVVESGGQVEGSIITEPH